MDVQAEIESRMEKIRAIFQYGVSISTDEADLDLLSIKLRSVENEFRSIGYEAAAMSLALKDISTHNNFSTWHSFIQRFAARYATQAHVGLGWAIAQQRLSDFSFVETLDPFMQCRVMDGFGYYEGIFRKRKTIWEMQVPANLKKTWLHAYDQGVGRSIWYICQADCNKISVMMRGFPVSRHKDFWRGIGTACCYVGGFDENFLKRLRKISSVHQDQLAVAAALVSATRTEAGSPSRYIELACEIWCNCSQKDALEIAETAKRYSAKNKDTCNAWISNIEKTFTTTTLEKGNKPAFIRKA